MHAFKVMYGKKMGSVIINQFAMRIGLARASHMSQLKDTTRILIKKDLDHTVITYFRTYIPLLFECQ